MNTSKKWAYDEDRCYHGIKNARGARIRVEHSTYGLTERQTPRVMYELTPLDPVITFHWGYLGSGPNAAAAAILTDALGFEPIVWLRQAFVWDFLGLDGNEFYYRRPAILRWARGTVIQVGATEQADVLNNLPPIEGDDYMFPPEEVRQRWREKNG